MAGPIQSSSYPLGSYSSPTPLNRSQRRDEEMDASARQQPRQAPVVEVLPDPERLRRVEAQAEAKAISLQPFRTPDELPKRHQEALATYRDTQAASFPGEGGELVGLDIYV